MSIHLIEFVLLQISLLQLYIKRIRETLKLFYFLRREAVQGCGLTLVTLIEKESLTTTRTKSYFKALMQLQEQRLKHC